MSAPVNHNSPSLLSTRIGGEDAYEVKFLIDESIAARIEDWARASLTPDPHADPALNGAYRTTSLYLDTPNLDVYHRTPSYRRRKYRVRRYENLDWAFLERKSKRADIVAKRRTTIPLADLSQLDIPLSLDSWPGHWFHQRIALRNLRPACIITYLRTAFNGSCSEGPLRITLDRSLSGALHDQWRIPAPHHPRGLLPNRIVLEFKFLNSMPRPFKELMYDLRLAQVPVSKYRLCREAWGVVSPQIALPAADPRTGSSQANIA